MVKRTTHRKRAGRGGDRLYELKVFITGGPMTEAFIKANPVVSRTILIRGSQTLAKLHEAIFDAFDREDEHMYEFQVGGRGPMDPKVRRYVLAGAFEEPIPGPRKPAGVVTQTTVDALGLKKGQAFGYWFDFGDDWWHQVDVLAIHEDAGKGKYPRVTAKVGESPPQYVDWDEEERGNAVRIKRGQPIELRVTAEERTLLSDQCLLLDERIEDKLKRAKGNSVRMTLDELEVLAGCASTAANHAESRKLQKKLDSICERIEALLGSHQED